MKKREADFQTKFNQWVRAMDFYGYFELKQTTKKSISFDCIEPHQHAGLQAAMRTGFTWKLSDADPRQKPFDSICMPPLPAYVVIKFPGAFYIINYYDFEMASPCEINDPESLTQKRAREICVKEVLL